MKIDFVINADWTGGGGWRRATVKINTKQAAEAYNEYYGTERRVNDTFIIENDSYIDNYEDYIIVTLDKNINLKGSGRKNDPFIINE